MFYVVWIKIATPKNAESQNNFAINFVNFSIMIVVLWLCCCVVMVVYFYLFGDSITVFDGCLICPVYLLVVDAE